MEEVLFGILVFSWFLISIAWVLALINPSLFKNKLKKFQGRKRLSKLFGSLWVITFIGAGIFAPPVAVELSSLNLEADQEVITETYDISGQLKGDYTTFTINDEDVSLDGENFSKTIELKPGDNNVHMYVTAFDEEAQEDKEVVNENYNIYFDYEGMLYAQELEADKRAEEELQKKLARVPQYETVRKKNIDGGFTAIMYIDDKLQDYLISNAIKDLRQHEGGNERISVLVFSKDNKKQVESILEETELNTLPKYIRANYEKHGDEEQLFWFPDGASGNKLALEVS